MRQRERKLPFLSGQLKTASSGFDDPAAVEGTEQERLAVFRRVRNEIRDCLKTFPA